MTDCNVLIDFLDQTQEKLEDLIQDVPDSEVLSIEALLFSKESPLDKNYSMSRFPQKIEKHGKYSISQAESEVIVKQIDLLIDEQYEGLRKIIDNERFNVGIKINYILAGQKWCGGKSCEFHPGRGGWYYKRDYRCKNKCCSSWSRQTCD